jgi:hypothetical protein
MRLDPIGLENRWAGLSSKGFDRLEDAQAFCEKNALDVEECALRGGTGSARSTSLAVIESRSLI